MLGVTLGLVVGQVIGALGFVAFAGLLLFRVLLLPEPGRRGTLVRLSYGGLALIAVSALVHLATGIAAGPPAVDLAVPVVLIQLGAVVAAACYVPDLVSQTLAGWRRGVAMATSGVLAVTLLLPVLVTRGGPAVVPDVLTVVHVLSLCTLAGGVVVVALVVLPGGTAAEGALNTLKILLRRSRVKVLVLVAVLVISGALALLLPSGLVSGLSVGFWVALVAKVVLFAILVVAAVHVRRQIQRAAFRSEHIAGSGDTLVGLRRIVRIEIVLAAAAVAATAVLTVLTPIG